MNESINQFIDVWQPESWITLKDNDLKLAKSTSSYNNSIIIYNMDFTG